jgi:hypothetical protein
MRELMAVVHVIINGVQRGWIMEGTDVLVRTDNTNVVYNLNRKRSGWRMRKALKEFLIRLKEKRIRVECLHIPDEENGVADSLSRLARSGDYGLKRGVLAEAERQLGVTADVDLFACAVNTQKERYWTLEKDRKAEGRNALAADYNWTEGVMLIHPPIALLMRCLMKIRQDCATAILIAPNWRGAIWMEMLRKMTMKQPVILGICMEVLEMGPSMKDTGALLPPGELAAYLVQG